MSLTKVGAGWPGGAGAYLHVTLRSSISSIPDYSGIRIKDRRGGDWWGSDGGLIPGATVEAETGADWSRVIT